MALVLPSCGSSGGEAGSPPATELGITVWPEGRDGRTLEATLACEPAGGTHPDPEAACEALARNGDALNPPPPDAVCTQIYGGPEEAEISGTFRGREVEARFSRTDGCQIDRWERLSPVLALSP